MIVVHITLGPLAPTSHAPPLPINPPPLTHPPHSPLSLTHAGMMRMQKGDGVYTHYSGYLLETGTQP